MSNNKIAPILLSGMHRSGTSMVTDILNKCGLIIGNKLDSNNESLFFQRINIWMMSLLGSSWDNPKIFDEIGHNSGGFITIVFPTTKLTATDLAKSDTG